MFVTLLQVLFVLIRLFILLLLGRFVLSWVLSFGRRWQPGRTAAASLEVVWSVTDPPLRALRRVIPPVRIGTVSIDLAALAVLVMLFLLSVVVGGLIQNMA